jgi:hypothetical protein
MAETELTLELRPWQDGSYTRIHLRGTMATVAQPKEVGRLLQVLSWWSGAPVDVALCVDGTNSGSCWLELWDDVLRRARGRHPCRIRIRGHETLTAQSDDDR